MRKILWLMLFFSPIAAFAQQDNQFTHADTLRGSNTPWRAWWDVKQYDLHVNINPEDSTISGFNAITYQVTKAPKEMQVDLMQPLKIDSIVQDGQSLSYRRDGNAYFVKTIGPQQLHAVNKITVYYHGKPIVAKNPPWDGGLIWTTDSLGRTWVSTACQGIGASIWWPNKDYQGDEPDSQRISITVPDTLIDVSNGRLESTVDNHNGTKTFSWFVDNPINNYDVEANVGKYVHFSDTYQGEKGPLSLDYWVLDYNLAKAKQQFTQVKSMLKCFEYWFGPYPWYKDGYKLIQAPHLGMEHQSGVAYGNHFQNGYLGRDLSHTGLGLKWDFIIIHESAHEWWGNNITTKDIADMWVHESFANYAESLYTECQQGKEAGEEYVRGTRQNVQNDIPVIGHYGVNDEGSGDMYYKGGNMLNTIRQIVDNDSLWRQILRGLNKNFWHQTVTGKQIEDYMISKSGKDLSKIFEQYLTTTQIPTLEYQINKGILKYRWTDAVSGFNMPVKVTLSKNNYSFIYPTPNWKTVKLAVKPRLFKVDKNFYIQMKEVD